MTAYDIDVEICLGFSHSGSICTYGTGTVELSDQEVAALVELIREKGTSDIGEMGLMQTHRDIFDKLDEAYRRAAYEAEENHWLWEGFYDGCYEYDTDELIAYCESECGFVSEAVDEDERQEAFFDEWLEPYLASLDKDSFRRFLYEHLNASVSIDSDELQYQISIPAAIAEMAKE